jgi:prepilin-type processing-associated H-X9-DG protein
MWGYLAIGGGSSVNRCSQYEGSTGRPFNVIIYPVDQADVTGTAGRTNMKQNWLGFHSWHPGGVNFVFLDGSVRFLTDASSDAFRLAIGTHQGGEALAIDQ